MKKTTLIFVLLTAISLSGCKEKTAPIETSEIALTTPFVWEAANVYFLLTDRFYNGDKSNDVNFDRTEETATLRGFEGGDIKGITQKLKEGYFQNLGVNAIWFTPVVEQVHGFVDEGTGVTYGFHGYWTKDWTQLDPNFGTKDDLAQLVETAHAQGIRIILDVVLNHTGPVTNEDPFWGTDWARENPNCAFTTYENTTKCSLVENLPDILTESTAEVGVPALLEEKWKAEGRYDKEMTELDTFFTENNLEKTPRNYIIKWLTDYISDFGVDAFRVDTTKHVEEQAWVVLREQADKAFKKYKTAHPEKVLDDNDFFMYGEVYNYSIDNGREFDLGDKKVDYFANGFDNLINFQFKYDAKGDYESLFHKYDSLSHTAFKGKSFMNYATSHDDGSPFDINREIPKETGTKLLLTPGLSQIYYGDETARDLTIEGTQGDATLRSFMNWDDHLKPDVKEILEHWQKLGQFRRDHPAVGAGRHQMTSAEPYTFKRTYEKDEYRDVVVVILDAPIGKKEIVVGDAFANLPRWQVGANSIKDRYSDQTATIEDGKVVINSPYDTVLLELNN